MKIVCFGPGPKFKGGISDYNTALAKSLNQQPGVDVSIVSWSSQYPAIIPREFVDKESKLDFLAGTEIKVHYLMDYNKPWTWRETYKYILSLKPDKVIIQWAIAIQGLPLGSLCRNLSKHKNIEVIYDLHFVIQKEGSSLDNYWTRRGIRYADTYITHAYKTVEELKTLLPNRNFHITEDGQRGASGESVIKLFHPIYSLYQEDPALDIEAFKKENNLKKHVFLFFGFIRKYKGLHNAIAAFAKVAEQRDDVSLMICGESFWKTLDSSKLSTKIKKALFGIAKKIFLNQKEGEGEYRPLKLVEKLGIEHLTFIDNKFVAKEDVPKYFQTADAVLLFYEYATPSGIESLSYNFKKPLIATKVGHFPETIEDGFNGYLAEAENIDSMAAQMIRYLDHPLPAENVETKTKDLSWENYCKAILKA
jgi:glycosyltransferase involved in cell wall biosynthesis